MQMRQDEQFLGLPKGISDAVEASSSNLLSRKARQQLVGQYCHSLYRWYTSVSQQVRNWNPDRSFDWQQLRQDHDGRLMDIIEGFYAVEQYAPDYTAELTQLARSSYGQSHFQIRWGSEEEKHADLWRNVLLFSRARTPDQLEQYTCELRANAWQAPFDTPLEMLFYTVFQERATQLIYLKTASLVRHRSTSGTPDPVLAKAISTIAVDEAAHYGFFLALSRVYLYYFPEESLQALVTVLRNFVMPAASIVPNYDAFIKILYKSHLFSPGIYGREVAKPALSALGVESVKEVERGLLQTKTAPGLEGGDRPNPFTGCNFAVLESAVRNLFDRVNRYESEIGLTRIQPTVFTAIQW
jgi:acyl-[acyl-carrier-protein] desaturase